MSIGDWLDRVLSGKPKCKYLFPHSPRFPKSVYWQSDTHSWMYLKKWDGTWHQDPIQAMQTDKGKRQMEAAGRFVERQRS